MANYGIRVGGGVSRLGTLRSRLAATGAAIGLLLAVEAPAQQALPATRALKVRGMALGMTPAETQRAIAAVGLPAVDRGTSVDPAKQGFAIQNVRPNDQNDLVFVSTMVSRARPGSRPQGSDEILAAAFTPEAGKERAWAIGMTRTYAPSEMPTVQNTLAALANKYGNTSWMSDMSHAAFLANMRQDQRVFGALLLWYWDAGGRQGGPAPHETCRYGLHQAYLLNQVSTSSMTTVNAAFSKPQWFDEARRAGCSKVVRAIVSWNVEGAVTKIDIEAVDLDAGVQASRRLAALIGTRDAAAARERAAVSSRNRPNF